jgi:hypothetical protein
MSIYFNNEVRYSRVPQRVQLEEFRDSLNLAIVRLDCRIARFKHVASKNTAMEFGDETVYRSYGTIP